LTSPPAPAKPTRGFTVTSPPPKPEETKAVAPPPVSLEDDAALDLFGLEVLIQRIPVTDRSPGLTVTRAALKDFDHLSAHNKQAVLDALALLGPHPETLREDRIFGHTHLVGLRATRRLRVICEKRHGSYAIQRIVDRSDRTFYRSER
jgi:hypothetical protein